MKIRCSVLGQSNSILNDGYFDYFAKHPSIEITRHGRLGASPSLLAPYFCEDAFFKDAEYCIIDLCVVDQVMNWAQAVDLYSIAQWLEWLVHQARFAGCQPVFLLIPHEASVTTYSPVMHLYRSVAEQQECYFLDMAAIIHDEMKRTGNPAKHYYRDSDHPSPEISKRIAEVLADFLVNMSGHSQTVRKVAAYIRNFEKLDIAQHATPEALVRRGNSLVKLDFIRLEENMVLEIPCGSIERISGFMINAAKSYRKLSIQGDRRIVKNVCINQNSGSSEFRPQIVPLMSPIRDYQGKITLSLAKNSEEVTEVSFSAKEPTGQIPDSVEISALIVERTPSMINYSTSVPVYKDIRQLSSETLPA